MNGPLNGGRLAWLGCAALLWLTLQRLLLLPWGWLPLSLAGLGLLGLWRGWYWALDLAWLGLGALCGGLMLWSGFSQRAPDAFSLLLAAVCCAAAAWNLSRLALALRPLKAEAVDPAVLNRHLLRLLLLLLCGAALALLSAGLQLQLNFELTVLLALLGFWGLAQALRRLAG